MHPVWTPDKPSLFGERFFEFCPKRNRDCAASSKLERDFALLAKHSPDVRKLVEQPIEMVVRLDGTWRRSRPDYYIQYESGKESFVEVKYSRDLCDAESRAHRQIAIQRQWCLENGYEHSVVTEKEIWSNPVLINSLRTLYYEYSRRFPELQPLAAELAPELVNYVLQLPGIRVGELISFAANRTRVDVARLAVMELIRCGLIDARLDVVRFTPLSRLFPKQEVRRA